MRFCARNLFY